MTPKADWSLDHVGIAVRDLDKAITHYQNSFKMVRSIREVVSEQMVELAFLESPNAKLELLTPINQSGPVQRFLDNRGEGLHHICYRVENIEIELKKLEQEGLKLIDRIPRNGAHGSKVGFIHPASSFGVLIELTQY